MRRRLLSQMQAEQDTLARSLEVKARLVPPIWLTENGSGTFQGVAQSSPAEVVPPPLPASNRGWPKGKKRGPRNA